MRTRIPMLALTVAVATPGALQAVPGPAQAPAFAQAEDTRWLPWIGCWEGASETGDATDAFLVCFELLPDQGGVAIVTHSDGVEVARETLRAGGSALPIAESGCSGTQRAHWSADERRVFLESQMDCGAGVTRSTNGVLAMLPEHRGWTEIHAVRSGEDPPMVGIRTFEVASPATLIGLGIADPAGGRELAATTARSAAGRALTAESVAEIVEVAGAPVAGALIAERGEPFALDTETLRALRDSGVPGEVIDVMVAVTWPDRFAITGGNTEPRAEALPPATAVAPSQRAQAPWPATVRATPFRGYSPWGFSYYDPYYYYGYGRGGLGSRWNSFGYPYYFGGPSVIVIESPQVERRPSALSRNRGAVTEGSGGAPPAVPASNASPRPATARPAPRTSSQGGSGGPAAAPPPATDRGGSATPQSSGSGGGDGGGRRAVPRTGN